MKWRNGRRGKGDEGEEDERKGGPEGEGIISGGVYVRASGG